MASPVVLIRIGCRPHLQGVQEAVVHAIIGDVLVADTGVVVLRVGLQMTINLMHCILC